MRRRRRRVWLRRRDTRPSWRCWRRVWILRFARHRAVSHTQSVEVKVKIEVRIRMSPRHYGHVREVKSLQLQRHQDKKYRNRGHTGFWSSRDTSRSGKRYPIDSLSLGLWFMLYYSSTLLPPPVSPDSRCDTDPLNEAHVPPLEDMAHHRPWPGG